MANPERIKVAAVCMSQAFQSDSRLKSQNENLQFHINSYVNSTVTPIRKRKNKSERSQVCQLELSFAGFAWGSLSCDRGSLLGFSKSKGAYLDTASHLFESLLKEGLLDSNRHLRFLKEGCDLVIWTVNV